MYINLDKFYSSNYRDFVHREALEDALKLVAEIYLKDTKVDTILNITFSVDEYGENPIYLTYLDEEKKEHIVKLKPNITEALLERLKEYAKITYVDEQDEKLRQELTQIIEQSKLEAIDTANNFTISHTNEVKNDILNIINQTSDDLKEYCDNKCEITLLAGKNYTDTKADEIYQRIDEEHEYNQERYVIGTINKDGSDTGKRFTEIGVTPNKKQYAHLVNFVDARNNHASGYLLNYDGYTNLVTNLPKAGIPIYLETHYGAPLFVSEIRFLANEFANKQDFINAELTDGVNDIRGFLINQENLEKLYSLDLSGYATKEELNSLDSKVDLVNQQVEANKEAISMLEPYQPVDLSNYYTKPESDDKFALKTNIPSVPDFKVDNSITPTKINYRRDTNAIEVFNGDTSLLNGAFVTPEQINNIVNNTRRLSEVSNTGKVPNIVWYPDGPVHYIRLVKDGECLRTHINDENSPNGETIVYSSTYKPAKESEVSALKTLVSSMGETNPIEMTIGYNGNSLELSNYSTYTSIGNTTFVNINCSFTAPFVSGTSPIWNRLSINSETLKSFPTFMIDCIMKTDTSISSYTTTTVFSNNDTMILVETPVIASNETISTSLISFNGSFVFQQ